MAKKSASIATVKDYQLFRYPGGKSKLIINPAFLALLYPLAQSAETFYEGFVGSAAVSLAVAIQFPEKKISITDKDLTISGFWELIANGTDEQVRELEDLIMGFAAMAVVRANKKAYRLPDDPKRELHDPEYEKPNLEKVRYFKKLRARKEAAEKGMEPPLSLVERAYFALFFNRTCFSGIAISDPIGGFNQVSEWTIDCRYNAPLLAERVRNLRILLRGRMTVSNADIWDWLPTVPANAPMYLDPPYYAKGEVLYPVHMENFEHARLAEALGARSNWIMSYDICDEIGEYYENQKLLKIPFRYSINGSKDVWNHQQEYLICSPEINTEAFESELVKWHADVEARTEEAKDRAARKKAMTPDPEAE